MSYTAERCSALERLLTIYYAVYLPIFCCVDGLLVLLL